MNLLIVSSEAVPYAQTGGLGDVVGVMTHELAARKHRVKLILPLYSSIDRSLFKLKIAIGMMNVEMGNTTLSCRVWQLDNGDPYDVYFIEYNRYFDRKSLYGDDNEAYLDNGKRFAFFSKAALDVAALLNFKPDVVHTNDWQTAIVTYYLKTWNWENGFFDRTASVLTIHNLGYQGETDLSASSFIGLNWMQVREEEFESLSTINLLKGGIFYADQITTVSPTYAKEILTEPGGCGLSEFLSRRANDITGILNGVDTKEWDPSSDQMLPATYSKDDLNGKRICKAELQKAFSLPINESIPIFAFIGRFADQKGLSMLKDIIDNVLAWELQLIILGSGDPFYSDFFGNLPQYYPEKASTYIGFQSNLAHLIEAGSDFFVMPSLYEPCGLNQMYSLLYGTPPIVRATGGLVDTVDNYDEKSRSGTGFVFQDITPNALLNTMGWALNTWYNNKESYLAIQYRGMGKDFSWNGSISEYERVYQRAQERRVHWQ